MHDRTCPIARALITAHTCVCRLMGGNVTVLVDQPNNQLVLYFSISGTSFKVVGWPFGPAP
jgi:hypothetical protein